MSAEPITLWPGVAPGSETWTHEEITAIDPESGMTAFRDVVVPTLTPVLPPDGQRNGTAIIIAPGGGFMALIWDHATQIADWFAERGVAAFVLKYRVGKTPEPGVAEGLMAGAPNPSDRRAWLAFLRQLVIEQAGLAADDGEQAVRVVRSRAAEWGVDAARIGVIGFSAGGTVALRAGVTTDGEARANFVINVCGAFLDREVPAEASPCLTIVANDDPLCDWCLDAVMEWRTVNAPVEVHVYEQGGHSADLAPRGLPFDAWTDVIVAWLKSRELL
jgi:acetyl esterase/lipase